MIVVINLDLGNAGSILNMLKKIGAEAGLSARPEDIKQADKIILPGVGSFDYAVSNLEKLMLRDVLEERVRKEEIPILGICLGAQLMTAGSQEGTLPGLGWIAGRTVRFDFGDNPHRLKIPHMGWNQIRLRKENMLFHSLGDREETRFYFVHSYHIVCDNQEDILAISYYGHEFTAAFARDNIYGVQFHPEKSHRFGMRILENFVGL